MRKLVIAISMLAVTVSAAFADPILDRQALMKERGKLVGGLSKVAKGEDPFDAAAVLTQLQALQANAEKFDVEALFPKGSDSGARTLLGLGAFDVRRMTVGPAFLSLAAQRLQNRVTVVGNPLRKGTDTSLPELFQLNPDLS